MSWKTILKKDKKDMRVGTVYPSDRSGKKIMMLTHEEIGRESCRKRV